MTATCTWRIWGLEASLTVTDPHRLGEARSIVDTIVADVDRACSRSRPDAELYGRSIRRGRPTRISPALCTLVDAALDAARASDGAVDPTVGRALVSLGRNRHLATESGRPEQAAHADGTLHVGPADHTVIRRHGDMLVVPEGITLDLDATAKAVAADLAADVIADEIGCGVMVDLGGDIAARGETPVGGWQVTIDDGPDEPRTQIALQGDCAVATSSTLHPRWRHRGRSMHHIIDPATGLPAEERWRTVTVVAGRCVDANTVSTACIVKGAAGADWVAATGLPARLVAADRSIIGCNGWPAPDRLAA
ncbi:FAD:protein FMN transferase [Williamsia phyllosphaerae]|uniref:FAD:protein FMN transferase n=1 Tax=Williamsia phyllosphaerae TaxID=885042 RepID=A0ABQ1UJD1_9NOCA|nr:FAD:protein FMN transferase [Williamsia phyllosphaerae]GGF18474.1 FAD:protein FMN transferase [Williamsia phyllosphaerae]